MVGRDGIDPPTPEFSVLVQAKTSATSGNDPQPIGALRSLPVAGVLVRLRGVAAHFPHAQSAEHPGREWIVPPKLKAVAISPSEFLGVAMGDGPQRGNVCCVGWWLVVVVVVCCCRCCLLVVLLLFGKRDLRGVIGR